MVLPNRRKNGKGVQLSDHEQAKMDAELLHSLLMIRMKPLGKQSTIYLVPKGYDILKNRRVHFQKRKNRVTGETERFLPKAKLEQVTVIQVAYYEDVKYYLVLSSSSNIRIVRGGYCTSLESTELTAPKIVLPKSKKSK